MVGVATSYVNPDTDGVAGCVALAGLAGSAGVPAPLTVALAGEINTETRELFTVAGVALPPTVPPSDHDSVALVDTHHPEQLPTWVRPALVRMVIDHHPGGNPSAFPHARIDNQYVGAACTLIAERYAERGAGPGPAVAVLLQGGILSNTLEFVAPSTTARDRAAYDRLDTLTSCGDTLATRLRAARARLVDGPTEAVLAADVKVFTHRVARLGLAQLEAPGASALADRDDFWPAYHRVRGRLGLDVLVVNLADLAASASLLAVTDPDWQQRIARRYGIGFAAGVGWTGELFLRKTHLVPMLAAQQP
ncbi:DHH family phosphoesterase [Plantactinospora sp. B24E8]|uniref:DHH family phosphoesterase n=1 Tax=Plantactinospora sp. B24E8 TaxID=3153567 RepID=UPI00325EE350